MRAGSLTLALLSACAHRAEVGVEDLAGALAFVEAVHPNPGALDLDAARAAIEAEAGRRDPDAVPSFLARVRGAQAMAGALGDAHVVVGTPARPIDGILPVFPIVREDAVLVDAFVEDVPAGTVLTAVDGVPVAALIDELTSFTAVDGGRADARRAQAIRSFASLLHRREGPRETWRIDTVSPGGVPSVWWVDGVDLDGAKALAAARVSKPAWGPPVDGPFPVWTPVDEDTVHLRIVAFGTREVAAWDTVVADGFAALRGDETVVLDLRGNAGGYRDLAITVARHLLHVPFVQFTSLFTRVRAIPARFRDRVGFPVVPDDALRTFPGARVDGGWRFDGDPLADTMVPVDRPHAGPLVLFVDDGTNSAAVELAVTLRAHRDEVVVVGIPTQGACDRHTGEVPVTYDLGDGVVVMLSLVDIALVPSPGCEAGHGVPIDVPVAPSVEGWLAGEDPWWAAWRGVKRP